MRKRIVVLFGVLFLVAAQPPAASAERSLVRKVKGVLRQIRLAPRYLQMWRDNRAVDVDERLTIDEYLHASPRKPLPARVMPPQVLERKVARAKHRLSTLKAASELVTDSVEKIGRRSELRRSANLEKGPLERLFGLPEERDLADGLLATAWLTDNVVQHLREALTYAEKRRVTTSAVKLVARSALESVETVNGAIKHVDLSFRTFRDHGPIDRYVDNVKFLRKLAADGDR